MPHQNLHRLTSDIVLWIDLLKFPPNLDAVKVVTEARFPEVDVGGHPVTRVGGS